MRCVEQEEQTIRWWGRDGHCKQTHNVYDRTARTSPPFELTVDSGDRAFLNFKSTWVHGWLWPPDDSQAPHRE